MEFRKVCTHCGVRRCVKGCAGDASSGDDVLVLYDSDVAILPDQTLDLIQKMTADHPREWRKLRYAAIFCFCDAGSSKCYGVVHGLFSELAIVQTCSS